MDDDLVSTAQLHPLVPSLAAAWPRQDISTAVWRARALSALEVMMRRRPTRTKPKYPALLDLNYVNGKLQDWIDNPWLLQENLPEGVLDKLAQAQQAIAEAIRLFPTEDG